MALGLVLALWLAPQLVRAECPAGCTCNKNGAVMCTGSIADIPSPMPVHTYHLILHATHVRALGKDELARLPLITRFAGLVNLTELDVSRNSVTYLDADVFRSLGSLRFLNLGRNLLARLPPALFHPLARLQHLMIYSNRLQTLEAGAFDGLLKELYLYGTKLTTVPWNLFPNLQKLSLRYNNLENLHPQLFHHLTNLQVLLLNNNRLRMNNRSALQNVTLGGNPWDCTCSTAGMLDWIWDHENHILDDPTCQEPFELQNISVASVRHVPCPTSPAVRKYKCRLENVVRLLCPCGKDLISYKSDKKHEDEVPK
uniref:LRRCT domain-containing protein n=1 Tax=Denticeps clupeoides TaxID=299321 RepID=A0AAY4E9H4_9TELE